MKTLPLLLIFISQSVIAKINWTVEHLPQMYHLSSELKSRPQNETEVKQMELKAHALIDLMSEKLRKLKLKQSDDPFFKFDLNSAEVIEVGIQVEAPVVHAEKLKSYPADKYLIGIYEGEIAPMISPFSDVKKVLNARSLQTKGDFAFLFKKSALPRKQGRMKILIPVR